MRVLFLRPRVCLLRFSDQANAALLFVWFASDSGNKMTGKKWSGGFDQVDDYFKNIAAECVDISGRRWTCLFIRLRCVGRLIDCVEVKVRACVWVGDEYGLSMCDHCLSAQCTRLKRSTQVVVRPDQINAHTRPTDVAIGTFVACSTPK